MRMCTQVSHDELHHPWTFSRGLLSALCVRVVVFVRVVLVFMVRLCVCCCLPQHNTVVSSEEFLSHENADILRRAQ